MSRRKSRRKPLNLKKYDAAYVICRYVSEDLMDEVERRAALNGHTLPKLATYPGSIQRPCCKCMESVWVGPRQQAMMAENRAVRIICMVCGARFANIADKFDVEQLGNPYKRAD